jgi:capsular exopolysaccharide synthesis family protein
MVLGIASGFGLAVLFEILDTRLALSDIEAFTEAPVIEIPVVDTWDVVWNSHDQLPNADAFRRLRTVLFAVPKQPAVETLLVTSVGYGEGRPMVAVHLAMALAEIGREVVIVDCGLREPVVHKVFNISNAIGLSDVLAQRSQADGALQETSSPLVKVMTSGHKSVEQVGALGSPQMLALLEELKDKNVVVLLHAPAYLEAPDASVLSQFVNGVLLVVAPSRYGKDAFRAVFQQLAQIQANIVGVAVIPDSRNGRGRIFQSRPRQFQLDSLQS